MAAGRNLESRVKRLLRSEDAQERAGIALLLVVAVLSTVGFSLIGQPRVRQVSGAREADAALRLAADPFPVHPR